MVWMCVYVHACPFEHMRIDTVGYSGECRKSAGDASVIGSCALRLRTLSIRQLLKLGKQSIPALAFIRGADRLQERLDGFIDLACLMTMIPDKLITSRSQGNGHNFTLQQGDVSRGLKRTGGSHWLESSEAKRLFTEGTLKLSGEEGAHGTKWKCWWRK